MLRKILLVVALVILGSTVGLTLVGSATRADGQKALAAVLERHEAEGLGTSFADLAAMAPPVDRERQLRLRAWMKASGPCLVSFSANRDLAWRLTDGGEPPETVREAHEAFRPEIETLEALLSEGDLCFTSLGWMPEDPASASFSDRLGGWIPNLLRMRAAYTWYAIETALADDPTHALEMLDRLHEGTTHSGCLIDSVIAVACDALRDDAMVVLALSGRCPDASLEAWLDESPRSARLVADGLRGERLRFGSPLGLDLVAGGTLQGHCGDGWEIDDLSDLWTWHVRSWAHGPAECAVHLEGMVALERYVRGEIDRRERDRKIEACEGLGQPYDLMMPNSNGTLLTASASSARHGLVRAAVLVALESIRRAAVPASTEEAVAWVRTARPHLVPKEDDAPLRYERVAEDRFRMGVDTSGDGDPLRTARREDEPRLDLRHDLLEIQIP